MRNKYKDTAVDDKIAQQKVTIIAANTKIVGEISTQYDLRVDGVIDGKLKTEGKLVVGESGTFQGEADCKSVDIGGLFDGILHVSGIATLRDKCVFKGEIHGDQLSIEPSARILGQIVSPQLTKEGTDKKAEEKAV